MTTADPFWSSISILLELVNNAQVKLYLKKVVGNILTGHVLNKKTTFLKRVRYESCNTQDAESYITNITCGLMEHDCIVWAAQLGCRFDNC